jgi:thioredoxin 1
MITNITKDNFEAEVLKADKPVLVDFWASWCGPCKMIAPEVQQIADEHPEIKVCKINVDEEGELSIKHGVMSIPTLMIFKNGEAAQTAVGYRKKDEIEELLK